MVNKILLSLVSVLLLSAMLVVFLSKSNVIRYESNQFKTINSINLSSLSRLKADAYSHLENQTNLNLANDLNITKQIIYAYKTDAEHQVTQFIELDSDSTISENQVFIYGLVTGLNGLPIEGVAVIESGKYSGTKTDKYGNYILTLSSTEKNYRTIIFRRSGYEEMINHLLDKDIESKTKILLNADLSYSTETATLNGRVGELTGQAIDGVVIKLSSLQRNLYYSTITDETGIFSFEGIKQGVNYQVRVVESPNYQTTELEDIWMAADTPPVNIQLQPIDLIKLNGVVVDSLGGYVPDFKLNIRSQINSTYETQIITDDLGRFEVIDFPTGDVLFFTSSPRFFKVIGRRLTGSSEMNLVVPIDIGTRVVSGWVRDENGQPVSNARAMLDAEFKIDSVISSSLLTTKTDEAGYFEFKNIGGGEHYVSIYAKGFNNQEVSYNTNSRMDQLYFELSTGNTSLINSESLKLKLESEQ